MPYPGRSIPLKFIHSRLNAKPKSLDQICTYEESRTIESIMTVYADQTVIFHRTSGCRSLDLIDQRYEIADFVDCGGDLGDGGVFAIFYVVVLQALGVVDWGFVADVYDGFDFGVVLGCEGFGGVDLV